MLLEAGVKVIFNERLDLKKEVTKKDLQFNPFKWKVAVKFSGRVFIDATYEGDLMAKAGVSFFVGRESNEQYNESMNGIFYSGLMGIRL